MSKPIKSRQGLTRCSSCRAHIQAAETPSATVCPFCGQNLHAPAAGLRAAGRGALLAASLMAFSACGGSGDTDTSDPAPSDSSAGGDDTSMGGDVAGDDAYDPGTADDNSAVAEYGVAPDDGDY